MAANPFADPSANGHRPSSVVIVNYRYDWNRARACLAARHGNHVQAVSDLLRAGARKP